MKITDYIRDLFLTYLDVEEIEKYEILTKEKINIRTYEKLKTKANKRKKYYKSISRVL